MTLKIERQSTKRGTTLRLIGRLRLEHLEGLKEEIKGTNGQVGLDLEDVTLVDVDVVRFLGICESGGMEVLHCSPYIRQWIAREQQTNG
jgi:hypothetical protein